MNEKQKCKFRDWFIDFCARYVFGLTEYELNRFEALLNE